MEGDETKQIKLIKGAGVDTNPPSAACSGAAEASLAVVKGAIVILPGYEHRSKPAIVHRLLT